MRTVRLGRVFDCVLVHDAVSDMAYVLRDERVGDDVLHDRHVMGLFPRAIWMGLIASAGFGLLAVRFEQSSYSDTGHEVVLGLRSTS